MIKLVVKKYTNFINSLLFHILYYVGIGGVAIVSKIFKKEFLDLKNIGSSFTKVTGSNNLDKMY